MYRSGRRINQYRSGISREVDNMARKVSRGAGSSEPNGHDELDNGKPALGRRALLTRGGVVAAGVVGAGAVATAVAGPASAQATTAVDMNTANEAGTNVAQPTELDADNSTAPAFILTNTGIDTEPEEGTDYEFSGPNLRLTPSTATGTTSAYEPTPSTVGGDLTATANGALWFTHDFTLASPPFIEPAPVHTEATANVYAQSEQPVRILDTRSATLRKSILNPSGNLNSAGQLEAGKTIAVSFSSLVYFADSVLANVTVTDPEAGGFLTIWSGAGTTRPITAAINYNKAETLSNFMVSGLSEYPVNSTTTDYVIAIYADSTTHVILDVSGFIMPGFEYAKFEVVGSPNQARNARLQRAQQAMRAAKRA
jgi:hypothetical protein